MEAGRLVHLTREGDYQIGQQFDSSEEMARREYLRGLKGDRARSALSVRHITFRQGYDLGVFGTLDQAAREAMKIIAEAHPKKIHPVPSDVDEWTKHMKFAINLYGAYFASFYEPYEQYVGGGADVVAAPWP